MKKVMAGVGEYVNKEGDTKTEWVQVGIQMENNNGPFLLLDPTVSLAGLLSRQNMWKAEQRRNGNEKAKIGKSLMCGIWDDSEEKPQKQDKKQPEVDDDDIPF